MNVFILGVLATLLLRALPSVAWLGFGAVVAIILLLARTRLSLSPAIHRALGFIAIGVLGFSYGGVWGHWRLSSVITPANEQQDIHVVGIISSLPQCQRVHEQDSCRFEVEVLAASRNADALPLARIALTTYGLAPPASGECIAAITRLKRPHGYFNPGSVDFEAARLRSGIDASGYVRQLDDAGVVSRECEGAGARVFSALHRTRQRVHDLIVRAAAGAPTTGLWLALVLGDYGRLTHEQWNWFNATGTSHLVTVSGFHIGLAALLGYGIGRCLLLLWRGHGRWRMSIPLLCSVAWALAYALLSGMSIPTQRSLLMIVAFTLTRWLRREYGVAYALRWALIVIVLVNPLAATAIGFWLSFASVTLLGVASHWRRQQGAYWRTLLQPHWVVFVGLAPVLLYLFGRVSSAALLANLLAVPWTTFAVMPTILLSLATAGGVAWLNAATTATLEYLCLWLRWCEQLPLPALMVTAGDAPLVIAALAVIAVLALSPAGLGLRRLALLLFAVVLLRAPPQHAQESATLSVFDVGQGLAVLLESDGQTLLYDSGPSFGGAASAAQFTVLPYLRWRGIDVLDAVVISHADDDHAGGLRDIRDTVGIDRLLTGEAIAQAPDAKPCHAEQQGLIGAVRFDVLYPPAGDDRVSGNNASCVVLITLGTHRILLTGDIEAAAEQRLLSSKRLPAAVDVLVAPHHGSNTSSTAALIAALQPRHVIFSVGYRNRYRHPHPRVVERYRQAGARQHRTDDAGMVRVELDASGALAVVDWRERWHRYWMAPASGD